MGYTVSNCDCCGPGGGCFPAGCSVRLDTWYVTFPKFPPYGCGCYDDLSEKTIQMDFWQPTGQNVSCLYRSDAFGDDCRMFLNIYTGIGDGGYDLDLGWGQTMIPGDPTINFSVHVRWQSNVQFNCLGENKNHTVVSNHTPYSCQVEEHDVPVIKPNP